MGRPVNWHTTTYRLPPETAPVACSACPAPATIGLTAFNPYSDRRQSYRCDACMPRLAAELGLPARVDLEAVVFPIDPKATETRCQDCRAIVRWITVGDHLTPIEPNGVGHRLVCPCTSAARRSA